MQFNIPLLPVAVDIRIERRPLTFKRPRLTMRRLMIAIALLAVLGGGYIQLLKNERWVIESRKWAAANARWENFYRQKSESARLAGLVSESERCAALAEQYRAHKWKWERPIWFPWLECPDEFFGPKSHLESAAGREIQRAEIEQQLWDRIRESREAQIRAALGVR